MISAETKRENSRRKELQKLHDYKWHESVIRLGHDNHLVNLINYFDECLSNGQNSIHNRRRFMDMFRQNIVYAWPKISKEMKMRLGVGEFSCFQRRISSEDIDNAMETTKKEGGYKINELPMFVRDFLTELFVNGNS